MIKPGWRTIVYAALCTLLLPLGVQAQDLTQTQGATPQPEQLRSAVPKDIVTRAKLRTELAALYFQAGDSIVALEELTLALSVNPDYAPAYSLRGLVLFQLKEFDSAEKDFKRALSLDDKNPEINNNFGWYLCQSGRAKESIDYFQKAIRNPLYRTPELAWLNVGACYIKLNELDAADDALRRIIRFSPENPQALYNLALVAYKRGNFEAAKMHLMTVVKKVEPNAELLWLLVRVDRRLGDRMSEESATAQLRRKYADSPEYQELLKGNYE